jgi:hypothetical protein
MNQDLINQLKSNAGSKLLSLLLALSLWMMVHDGEIIEVSRKIKVHFVLPPDLHIRDGEVRFKELSLSGPRSLIKTIPDPLEINVPLLSARPGALKFRIDKELLTLDPKIKITIHEPYCLITIDAIRKQKNQRK